MAFGDDNFELILPSYLVDPDKSRLRDALKQFTLDEKGKVIDYSDFYKVFQHAYFMQSDLVKEIRVSKWNDEKAIYEKVYTDAIIVSNTCDISFENKHDVNTKQCLFAPLVDFKEYLLDLEKAGCKPEQIESFSNAVKAQLRTNIFYLPTNHKDGKEYIVLLDNVFWFPTTELNSYIDNIDENRISTLSHFGYYLFILKLSYHLCRLPEQCDREINMPL
jgi:hypothetical protein